MCKIELLLLCVSLCMCRSEPQNVTSADLCHDIKISAKNLLLVASSYEATNGRWPTSFEELEPAIKEGNSSPEAFSGGAANWKFRVTDGNFFEVEYIGKEARKCGMKVFSNK